MSVTIIGWLAMAVFASSYFFRRPLTLRRIQAGAALLVANLVVAGAALYSSFSPRRTEGNSLP